MIGKTLGPYKIIEQLGAGGMGEVYLGEDTRLGRKVAIKVLPAEFASDPERLARFEQEARASAALNHPHIAVVHDVGSEPGEDGTTTHFMVQEYLEGQSLRERLEKGALPLDKALDLSIEVGEALIAAHKAGIIHRDLKPDNIFVTEEGHAKVLDFGLAKLTEMAAPTGTSASMSPTMLGTVAGQVMGTAGYMAPEQVNGEEVDHRADLFAFGSVLYEMVTGRRAFAGESVVQTLSKIAHEEPAPVSEIVATSPADLERIIRKCLAKHPGRRYQHADDMAVDLRTLSIEVESGTARPAAGSIPGADTFSAEAGGHESAAGAGAAGSTGRLAAMVAAAVLITALATTFFVRALSSPQAARPERLIIDVPESQTLAISFTGFDLFDPLAISPDGTQVAYAAVSSGEAAIYLRRLGEYVAAPIPGSEGGISPMFSPDGEWIAFFDTDNALNKIPVIGGASQPITTGPASSYHSADWGPDDVIVFSTAAGLMKVPAAGGTPEPVGPTGLAIDEPLLWPSFLPGGGHVLVTLRDTLTIAVVDMSTGEAQELGVVGSYARYVGTGHLVFAVGHALFGVPFDLDSRTTTGNPVPVLDGVSAGLLGLSRFAVAPDNGSLIYLPDDGAAARRLVWVDRSGAATAVLDEEREFSAPRLSPDGDRIAVVADSGSNSWEVWIVEVSNGSLTRLTVDGNGDSPVWSPDGSWVYFSSVREGNRNLYRRRADFSGDAEIVLDREFAQWPQAVSEEGLISAIELTPDGSFDIIVVSTESGEVDPLAATPATEGSHALSPDGRWIAYVSDASQSVEVYVEPFPEGGGRVTISNNGGNHPVWSPDGRTIFFNRGNKMLAVDVTAEPEFSHGAPYELFDHPYYDSANRQFDIAPDGERFLMLETNEAAAESSSHINIILNWFEELKQRVPTGR